MFQEINIKQSHPSSHIQQAYVTKKGVFVLATQAKTITIYHHSNPTQVLNLQKQLGYKLTYKKCVSINCIDLPSQSDGDCILILLDSVLYIIWLKLLHSQKSHLKLTTQMLAIETIPILSQQEKAYRRKELHFIGVQGNKALFCLHLLNTSFKIYSYCIQINQSINLQKTLHLNLTFSEQDQNQLQDMLVNYQIKLFNHFVFVYEVLGRKEESHRLFYIDVLGYAEEVQILRLPQNLNYSALKEIYIVPLHKQIQSSTVVLFFQVKANLQIVEINLNNPAVPLKKIQHPLILHKIISSSMSPEALEFKGQKYCTDTLNFLIHGCNNLMSEDKLIIIGAPFAHNPKSIINELIVPTQIRKVVSNGTSSFIITNEGISQIILTSKSQIYSLFLKQLSDSESLARMIQQILD